MGRDIRRDSNMITAPHVSRMRTELIHEANVTGTQFKLLHGVTIDGMNAYQFVTRGVDRIALTEPMTLYTAWCSTFSTVEHVSNRPVIKPVV
jgi:hypothetical protein